VDRVTAIVREVSAFSRAGLGDPEQAGLNELVENAVNVASLRYPVTIERCYGQLPPVCCTPQHLKQMLLHLLINAAQAVGDSGRIRIVTQAIGDDVLIRVEDDGCGMPDEVLERIFDPFFTTRPAGEGTGLGLALGYQIVRNHGGEIVVDSLIAEGWNEGFLNRMRGIFTGQTSRNQMFAMFMGGGPGGGDPEAFRERPGEGGGGAGFDFGQMRELASLIMPGVGLGTLFGRLGRGGGGEAPLAEPGTYTLTMSIGDRTFTQELVVDRVGELTGQSSPFEAEWERWIRRLDRMR